MTPAEISTVILSAFAFIVSVVALVWQLVRSRWERPVVVVGGSFSSQGSSQSPIPRISLRIDVTNVGERAVSIVAVGWIMSADEQSVQYIGLDEREESAFPMRLDAHDSKTWTIPRGPASAVKQVGLPYARVVQRPTWRERRRGVLPERTIIGELGSHIAPDATLARERFTGSGKKPVA